jgi:hypothetical protein
MTDVCFHDHHLGVVRIYESFCDKRLKEGRKGLEERSDVEHTTWLIVNPQLRPCDCLEKLVERSEPAWKHDECTRSVSHVSLPLMH